MQKILIDTDPGQDIDDLLAIHFALLRPEIDIRAVTTVTYPTAGRARLVKRLLRYHGREEVQVAAGSEYPLRVFTPDEVRRQHDLAFSMNHAGFAEPADPRDEPDSHDATGLIIRTIEEHAGEIVVVGIGPLTNLAVALQRKPSIAPKIKAIYLMGGEVAILHNEHNIAFDPVAAEIVLRSGVPITLGTWDVTRRFEILPDETERLRADSSPANQALARAIDLWEPCRGGKPGPVMYDLFPFVWCFDRSLYTVEKRPIRVETRGEFTRGMTLRGGDVEMEVTTEIDADAVKRLYFDTVLGS